MNPVAEAHTDLLGIAADTAAEGDRAQSRRRR